MFQVSQAASDECWLKNFAPANSRRCALSPLISGCAMGLGARKARAQAPTSFNRYPRSRTAAVHLPERRRLWESKNGDGPRPKEIGRGLLGRSGGGAGSSRLLQRPAPSASSTSTPPGTGHHHVSQLRCLLPHHSTSAFFRVQWSPPGQMQKAYQSLTSDSGRGIQQDINLAEIDFAVMAVTSPKRRRNGVLQAPLCPGERRGHFCL